MFEVATALVTMLEASQKELETKDPAAARTIAAIIKGITLDQDKKTSGITREAALRLTREGILSPVMNDLIKAAVIHGNTGEGALLSFATAMGLPILKVQHFYTELLKDLPKLVDAHVKSLIPNVSKIRDDAAASKRIGSEVYSLSQRMEDAVDNFIIGNLGDHINSISLAIKDVFDVFSSQLFKELFGPEVPVELAKKLAYRVIEQKFGNTPVAEMLKSGIGTIIDFGDSTIDRRSMLEASLANFVSITPRMVSGLVGGISEFAPSWKPVAKAVEEWEEKYRNAAADQISAVVDYFTTDKKIRNRATESIRLNFNESIAQLTEDIQKIGDQSLFEVPKEVIARRKELEKVFEYAKANNIPFNKNMERAKQLLTQLTERISEIKTARAQKIQIDSSTVWMTSSGSYGL